MRGQASMEYLVITAFSLLALSLVLIIIIDQVQSVKAQAAIGETVRLMDALVGMVDTVSWEGPGSVRSASIPTPAGAVNLTGGDGYLLLTIRQPDGSISTALRTVKARVNASISLPQVESIPTYRVANENGTVLINLTTP